MRRRIALLAAAAVLTACIAGCSARSDEKPNGTNSVKPDTTPGTVLPEGNDAAQGGGAGGTNDPDNGIFEDNSVLPGGDALPDDTLNGVENGTNDILDSTKRAVIPNG